MSLTVDPQLYHEYDEPPYEVDGPKLYAPAAPFGAAIDAWLAYQEKLAGGCLHNQGGRSNHSGMPTVAGLTQLAEMAGTSTRGLWAWRNGSRAYIEQGCADRLAIALDIPLPMLATEFKSLNAWRKS